MEKFLEREARLYEQEWEKPEGPPLLGMYVRRWVWMGDGRQNGDEEAAPRGDAVDQRTS
jgi:hypothetical protein